MKKPPSQTMKGERTVYVDFIRRLGYPRGTRSFASLDHSSFAHILSVKILMNRKFFSGRLSTTNKKRVDNL